jgi:hypothetical protein
MTPCISLARIPEKEEGYWAGEEDNDALLAKHTKVLLRTRGARSVSRSVVLKVTSSRGCQPAQVRVVGNNRTRAGLVGQVGIVKRAVGLGERPVAHAHSARCAQLPLPGV